MRFEDCFPPVDTILALEPEELAVPLLKYLVAQSGIGSNDLHLGNFINGVRSYEGSKYPQMSQRLTEAWIWLERELMLAPEPGKDRGWLYVTKRGQALANSGDMNKYRKGNIIPPNSLDAVLANKVLPIFIRGDYDTAVFQAFKEVEIRVRVKAALPQDSVGTALMRNAFHPKTGRLADEERVDAEREAMSSLFAGAIGLFKNPASHRDVNWDSAEECAELIYLANHLIRIVDRLSNTEK